jgi:hypothetical protein
LGFRLGVSSSAEDKSELENQLESSKGRSAGWRAKNSCDESMSRRIPPRRPEERSQLRVFSFWFLLSADEFGGHMLTRTPAWIGLHAKIFGFQNRSGRAFRARACLARGEFVKT